MATFRLEISPSRTILLSVASQVHHPDPYAETVAAAVCVRRGDRVFLMLPRLVEWWESILGIMRLGAVSMPGTTLLTSKDIVYRANLAEARRRAGGRGRVTPAEPRAGALRVQLPVPGIPSAS